MYICLCRTFMNRKMKREYCMCDVQSSKLGSFTNKEMNTEHNNTTAQGTHIPEFNMI